MGVKDKVYLISATAGTAGAVLAQNGPAASLGGSLAGGLIPASTALVINEEPATPGQISRAESAGRRYVAKLSPAKKAYYKKQEIKYVAVKTTSKPQSRGSSIMVYDLEEKKIANEKVFDVRIEPESGSKVKVDTYVSEYIGSGT